MAIITGSPTDDLLIGTTTDDQIQGMEGHDVIDGGAGPDLLMGGIGNDIYIFRQGDGADVIAEFDGGGFDTVNMTGGLYPSDVTLIRNGNDLIIQSLTSPDQITVIGQFDPFLPQAGIERILFSDGTIWDTAAIETRINSGNANVASPLADVIVGTPGSDVINGMDGNDTLSGENGDDTLNGGAGNDNLFGGTGNDTLMGGDGNDVLRGMSGNDRLFGGMGNDMYIIGRGSALDEIVDDGGYDTLYLGSPNNPGSYRPDTLQLQRNVTDLVLFSTDTGSAITIRNYFDPYNPQNTNQQGAIERIVFEDGTIWETEQILTRLNNFNNNYTTYGNDVILGSDFGEFVTGWEGNDTVSGGGGNDQVMGELGNDRLFGNAGNDILIGGDGNDQLSGNAGDDILDGGWGNDTYYFNRGDGHDTINEAYSNENNRVVFGEGISLENLRLRQEAGGVVFEIIGSGDSLYLANTFLNPNGPKMVNQFVFADGTVMDLAQFQSVMVGTPLNDWLYGSPGNDTLLGLGGDDTLIGMEGNDVLQGGQGNDTLSGGSGSDTYIYNLGDGLDRITIDNRYQPMPQPGTVNGIDTLKLGDGIDPSSVMLMQWGSDLRIGFLFSPGDEIVVEGFFLPQQTEANLDQIVFADGTVWNAEAITNRAIQYNNNYPTPQGDTLSGTSQGEFIGGMAGNDTISGGAGDDQLFGDQGHDRLYGNAGNDGLLGGEGNDLLVGGVGNDFLAGEAGSDSYQFNTGDGIDVIMEDDRYPIPLGTNVDVIRLGNGYDAASVQLQRSGDDLVIGTFGGSDQITVRNHFTLDYTDGAAHSAIENIVFADGTIWNTEAINNRVNGPLTGMTMAGTAMMDYLNGGYGNDTISGGAGDDQIIGNFGNDRLFGNAGNDLLDGGVGNDTYYFNLGDGRDVINDWAPGENNRVVFGAGIGIENLRVVQYGSDIVIEVIGTGDMFGSGDSLLLTNTVFDPNGPRAINQFELSDGSIFNLNQLQNIIRGTELNDSLSDSLGDDVIAGLGGDDTIYALNGNNTLLGGAGNDVMNGGWGNDVLIGGTGNDQLNGFKGNDTYVYNLGDGMDRITSDYFYPPTAGAINGLDTLRLGEGIDPSSIFLQQSSEDLRISFSNNMGDEIVVQGYFSPMLSDRPLDQIVFTDGTVWNTEAIDNRVRQYGNFWPTAMGDTLVGTPISDFINGMEGNDTISGGAGNDQLEGQSGNDALYGNQGNDFLIGGEGNDVLAGNAGNDTLAGGAGNDTYIYNLGDGADWIFPFDPYQPLPLPGTVNGIDSLQLGEGIDPATVLLTQMGNDLRVQFQNSPGDEIVVAGYYAPEITDSALDQIIFADGTVWNSEAIGNRVNQYNYNWPTPMGDTIAGSARMEYLTGLDGNDTISGGAGDDQIMGDAGNDRLFGNTGNDLLDGGTGNDTYYFNIGDGRDAIIELTPGDNNRVVFGAGVSVQNLHVMQAGPDVVIELIGTGDIVGNGDSLRLTNTVFDPNGPRAVSQFEFADGLVLNLDQLQTILVGTNDRNFPDFLEGTSGNDTIVALDGPDRIAGHAGNDTLIGGQGADAYSFNLGDGQDVIIDSDPSSEFFNVDSVQFGAGITQEIMTPGRMGNDLVVDITSGDRITVRDWYTSPANQIEFWLFADNSMLNAAQLQAWADNLSPQVARPLDAQSANEDTPFYFAIPFGTFVDPNSTDLLRFSATLADGSPLPSWLSFDAIYGLFTGQPGNNDVGNLSVRVTATDNYGMSVTNDFALAVLNVNDAPTIANSLLDSATAEENTFTYVVPATTFADVDQGDTLTYAATLTDGTALPSWLNFNAVTRTFSSNLLDGNAGVLNVRVTATDQSSASVFDDFTITIADSIATVINGTSSNNTLNGTAFRDVINGLGGTDTLYGYAGNDILDGGAGSDTMYGGAGDDSYVVNSTGDKVIENANEGIDTVSSSVSFTLGNNVENLTLTGSASLSATGNTLDNVLIGNSAGNTLTGNAGNDWLDGGAGSDTMRGGTGNDTYVVSSSGDVVTENANEGTDTVRTSISYTLGTNVENLVLTGAGNASGTGNSLNNSLIGNSASNTLTGNAGNDVLQGLGGNDTLRGGTGSDTYLFARGDGVDTISENDSTVGNTDTVSFSVNPLDLVLQQSGANLLISLHGGLDSMTVQNWYSGSQYQTEVLRATDGSTLANSQVAQLIQAMASFSASHGGISWDQAIDQNATEVQAVLTAYWQPAV
jgi:Ca2+-binding RTX toxin-like protein